MLVIGIDPGASGGLCALWPHETRHLHIDVIKMPDTVRDIVDWLRDHDSARRVYIESVHSMPGQGVASSFKFGRGFGNLEAAAIALEMPIEYVTPQKWQRAMGCLTKGDKNVTKAAAQQLFPQVKVTHAIADAMLIAEYGRRLELQR